MTVVNLEVAEVELESLIERARSGEEILVQDGENIVRLEPIFEDNTEVDNPD